MAARHAYLTGKTNRTSEAPESSKEVRELLVEHGFASIGEVSANAPKLSAPAKSSVSVDQLRRRLNALKK